MNNNEEIIILEVYNDFTNAQFAQIKLRDEEVESFLEDENVVGVNPLGGVELKIFARDLLKAKEIISK